MLMADCVPGGGGRPALGAAMKRIEAASRHLARAKMRGEVDFGRPDASKLRASPSAPSASTATTAAADDDASAPAAAAAVPSAGSEDKGKDEGDHTFEAMHEWQKRHERPAPTLCLTSDKDVVVPARGVRAYAASLRAAQPQRDVRVHTLAGSHCQLDVGDAAGYAEAVRELCELAVAAAATLPPVAASAVDVSDAAPARTPTTREALLRHTAHTRAASAAAGKEQGSDETGDDVDGLSSSNPPPSEWRDFFARHELATAFAGSAADAPSLELAEAFAELETGGRPALLQRLKAAGVGALPLRQKLANAIGKEARSRGRS